MAFHIVIPERFFNPVQVESLGSAAKTLTGGQIPFAVAVGRQGDGRAYGAAHGFQAFEVAVHAGAYLHLDAGEAFIHRALRTCYQLIVGNAEPADVGVVGANFVAHLATQQLPQGHASRFGLQVPQRDIDGGLRQRDDAGAPHPLQGRVARELEPQAVDVHRVLADQQRRMANYIGAKLGVAVDVIPVSSANRIPYLQTKKASLVIATLGKNPDREKQIDFAGAYSPFFQAVFGPRTINIKSFTDLAGKTIGVTRGSVEDEELNKLAPSGTDIRRFDDNFKTVNAFTAGQVQLIATGASVAGNIMSKSPQLRTEYKLLLKESPNYIGVPKGEDSLRLAVNGIIAEAKKNGDLDKIALKWLGRPAGDLPQ